MIIKNLNHVKAFLHVIETGSITAASRQLRKSQTSISNSVTNLEIDLGIDLLLREGHKATPTESGLKLLPYFRNLLDYTYVIDDVINSLQTKRQKLSLFIDNAIPPSLCNAVEHLIRSEEFECVTVKRGSPADSFQKLKEGDIQVAITIHEEVKTKLFSQSVLGYCRGVAVCHRDLALAKVDITSINDMVRYRQIALACSAAEVSPSFVPVSDEVCYVDNFCDMKSLVMRGLGWGILPSHIVQSELESGTFVDLSKDYEQGGILTKIYCYFSAHLLQHQSFKNFLSTAKHTVQDLNAPKSTPTPLLRREASIPFLNRAS